MHDEVAYKRLMVEYAEADKIMNAIKSVYLGTNFPEKFWVPRAKHDGLITEEEYQLLKRCHSF